MPIVTTVCRRGNNDVNSNSQGRGRSMRAQGLAGGTLDVLASDPYICGMRLAMVPAALLITRVTIMADAVSITSPDHAQTYAYGAVTWHQLYLKRTRSELAVRITFSNWPYAGDDEPRRDEAFDF